MLAADAVDRRMREQQHKALAGRARGARRSCCSCRWGAAGHAWYDPMCPERPI